MPKKIDTKKNPPFAGVQWLGQELVDLPAWVDSATPSHDAQLIIVVDGMRYVVVFGYWLVVDGDRVVVLSDDEVHARYTTVDV